MQHRRGDWDKIDIVTLDVESGSVGSPMRSDGPWPLSAPRGPEGSGLAML